MKVNWLGKYALGVIGTSVGLRVLGEALNATVLSPKITCPKCDGSFDVNSRRCDDCGWEYHEDGR